MSGRVDVITGWSCNSRCRFCSQGTLRDRVGVLTDDVVRQRIAQARAVGDVLVLTGGEPTLRDELPAWVAFARGLGFRRVEVQSNGRMLSYRGVVSRLVEAGVSSLQIALHGHEALLHDWHTRAEGSFEQAVRGLQRAKAHELPVLVTTVITRSNHRHLKELAAFAVSLGADGWRAAFARPVGLAGADLVQIVPRYSLVAPHLAQAVGVLRRVRRPASVKGVPPCVLGGDERGLVDLRPALAEAHVGPEPVVDGGDEDRRVHGPPCEGCAARARCPGIHAAYARRYGFEELSPINEVRAA